MSRLDFVTLLCLGCVVWYGQSAAAADPPPPAPATEESSSEFDRIRELIRAAEHLEAAGAIDLAQQAREQAARMLEQEAVRLAREQAQLEELSREVHQSPILIQALIIEAREFPADFLVSVIGQYGGELIRPDATGGDALPSAAILGDGVSAAEAIRSLAEQAEIEILSRPQIMALDGTSAQIQVGQTVPVVEGVTISPAGAAQPSYVEETAGIFLSITPSIETEGRIRLELTVEHSRFSESKIPLFTDPVTGDVINSPVKDVMTAQAAFTIPNDRELLFPVNPRPVNGEPESTLLLVLRPRVVPVGNQ